MATERSDEYKRQAAERAVEFVQSGMIIGLGHGSTAAYALQAIARQLGTGELYSVLGVPCSQQVAETAQHLGIPLTTLEEHPRLDLTIDGADEITGDLDLIKGGGGALLREKIVAQASEVLLIVADATKLSPTLGIRAMVPVEVLPFGWRTQLRYLESLGACVVLREAGGVPVFTDQGNYIIDCNFGPIIDPEGIAGELAGRAGILAHGLFLGLATAVVLAGPTGLRILQ